MLIRHFDFGLARGIELRYIDEILRKIKGAEYEIHAFEASFKSYAHCVKAYRNYPRVKIYHIAISNSNEKLIKLYHTPQTRQAIGVGHSIYKTKDNVLENDFEEVPSIRFTDWLEQQNICLTDSFNIIRSNMEGAEWDLFADLVAHDYVKHINIISGTGNDIYKIKELKEDGTAQAFKKMCSTHNIGFHKFSSHNIHSNVHFQKLLVEANPDFKESLMSERPIIKFVFPALKTLVCEGSLMTISWRKLGNPGPKLNISLRAGYKPGYGNVCTICKSLDSSIQEFQWIVQPETNRNGKTIYSNRYLIMIQSIEHYPHMIALSNEFEIRESAS